MVFTCSGTGGLEAAVVNTIAPGDSVLSVSIGVFGDRFASIAQTYGAKVTKLSFELGQAADPAAIEQALAADPEIRAVLVTHNETSTSVTNPLQEIARVVKAADKLLLVDAISSLGSINVATDAWGLDVVVSGSQKGWMVPPGLAFMSMSERAWEAHARSKTPRFYLEAARHRDSQAKGQTPWTPALSLFFATDVALEMLEREGWENVYARHDRVAEFTRRGVRELGLEPLADPRFASSTVTAVKVPEGVDVSVLRKTLREEHGVVLAGGQGPLQGKIFRIGHLGLVAEQDISEALTALGTVLSGLGFRPAARV
jgi:aspartate aminotransferase-like enzyme